MGHTVCLGHQARRLRLPRGQRVAGQGPEEVHQDLLLLPREVLPAGLSEHHEGLQEIREDPFPAGGGRGQVTVQLALRHEGRLGIFQLWLIVCCHCSSLSLFPVSLSVLTVIIVTLSILNMIVIYTILYQFYPLKYSQL